ncbi:hypothetical protein BDZ91DRAFT_763923 [Kalaharituber pfeilii]|nr:hypothetical protein BDZ91DRAFT_763923 [Kalaharituber pfeilii]
MQKDTVTAIDSLEEEYSPPPPGKEDCRYSKVALLCQRHSTFGVYHLAYWMHKGHTFTPPTLSRHIGSAGYKQRALLILIVIYVIGGFFRKIVLIIILKLKLTKTIMILRMVGWLCVVGETFLGRNIYVTRGGGWRRVLPVTDHDQLP